MVSNRFTQFSLLLWVITVAVFGWFFVRGNTTVGSDGRAAIVLQAGERAIVLEEMRGLLVATQGILEASNNGDMKQVSAAAAKAGMANAADLNPALMAKLPLEFKQLGMSVHHDMDNIAQAAAEGKSTSEILKMTSNMLNKCIGCHAAWQLQAAD